MNKVVLAIGTVAVLGGGYVGASWYAGQQVESSLAAGASELSKYPIIKTVSRDFQKGLFSSVENVTYQIGCESGLEAGNPLQGKVGTITLKNSISHQPFNLAIQTQIQYDDKIKAELAKIFKDKEPLSIQTKLGLTGSLQTELTTPSFIVDDAEGRMEWKGLSANIKSDRELSFLDSHFKMGGFDLVLKAKGEQISIGEIDYQSNRKKVADGLYAGNDQLTIAAMSFNGKDSAKSFNLGKSDFSGETQIDAGFMRSAFKGSIADVALNKKKIGDLNLDYALEHIDTKAIKAINDAVWVNGILQCKSDPALQTKVMLEQIQAIVEKDPKFTQKLALKTAEGETNLSLQLLGKGLTKADLASPDLLMAKLDAALALQVPNAFVERIIREMDTPENAEAKLTMFQAGLGASVQQGYVESDGKMIKSNFTLQNGKTTLNGKPFDLKQFKGL
mgnify:CR=1 FL=1